MTANDKKQIIESQYDLLRAYQYKANSQILYNLIQAKSLFELPNYNRSLYLDAKKFVEAYIKAADNLDYGYDEILIDKLKASVKALKEKQQLSILYYARRMMGTRGYDTDDLLCEIRRIERSVAWGGDWKQKIYAICLWLSSRWWALIGSYLIYVVVLSVMLLPAPFEWMQMFAIELKQLNGDRTINHIMNTIGLVSGNEEMTPQILPIGISGMAVYLIGKLLFYLIIANFVYRKLEEYITLK